MLSTVSLNRDEMAGVEDTGWMPQWRIVSTVLLNRDDIAAAEENCEHRLVKPGRGFGLGGHRILSTVSLNRDEGMSAEDATWENQHRL
jgi:hypothetical protein